MGLGTHYRCLSSDPDRQVTGFATAVPLRAVWALSDLARGVWVYLGWLAWSAPKNECAASTTLVVFGGARLAEQLQALGR